MDELIINFEENKSAWDIFLSKSPQRTIFLSSKFLDSLGPKYSLLTCYLNGKVVAGAAVIFDKNGQPLSSPFPYTQFQGLLLSDNSDKKKHTIISYENKIAEFFIDEITKKYKYICFSNSWRLNDLRPFLWHAYKESVTKKFKIEPRYTGILDLKPYKDINLFLPSIRSVRRQEFKKAFSDIKIQFSDNILILDDLHAKTFERQNIKRVNNASELIRSIASSALKNNYGKLCLAIKDDKPIAATLFLYDDRTAYYLIGANDPNYRKSNANTFLIINMIKDAIENKYLEIDFCGLNSPNRGDFKVSFNAEPKLYFNCSLE